MRTNLRSLVNEHYEKMPYFYTRKDNLYEINQMLKLDIKEDEVYEYILSLESFDCEEAIFLFNILTQEISRYFDFWESFISQR